LPTSTTQRILASNMPSRLLVSQSPRVCLPWKHGLTSGLVLSSVGGAPIGTVIGGFVATLHHNPSWIFWTLLIMGGVVQIVHFFFVPETRTTIILDREAKKRRKNGENCWGPNELKEKRFSAKEIGLIWWRPFQMFLTEPIVLCLSLLSGFSDSLVFIFMESYTPIFEQWGFNQWEIGLCFLS